MKTTLRNVTFKNGSEIEEIVIKDKSVDKVIELIKKLTEVTNVEITREDLVKLSNVEDSIDIATINETDTEELSRMESAYKLHNMRKDMDIDEPHNNVKLIQSLLEHPQFTLDLTDVLINMDDDLICSVEDVAELFNIKMNYLSIIVRNRLCPLPSIVVAYSEICILRVGNNINNIKALIFDNGLENLIGIAVGKRIIFKSGQYVSYSDLDMVGHLGLPNNYYNILNNVYETRKDTFIDEVINENVEDDTVEDNVDGGYSSNEFFQYKREACRARIAEVFKRYDSIEEEHINYRYKNVIGKKTAFFIDKLISILNDDNEDTLKHAHSYISDIRLDLSKKFDIDTLTFNGVNPCYRTKDYLSYRLPGNKLKAKHIMFTPEGRLLFITFRNNNVLDLDNREYIQVESYKQLEQLYRQGK